MCVNGKYISLLTHHNNINIVTNNCNSPQKFRLRKLCKSFLTSVPKAGPIFPGFLLLHRRCDRWINQAETSGHWLGPSSSNCSPLPLAVLTMGKPTLSCHHNFILTLQPQNWQS